MKRVKTASKYSHGARNLLILGLASIVIAIATTGVSLAIYHNSGDIYLDRSRPGFLPDKEEIEEEEEKEPDEEYVFQKSGKITVEVLDEYLEELDLEVRAIDSYEKPFAESALSDESLGIPIERVNDAPVEGSESTENT